MNKQSAGLQALITNKCTYYINTHAHTHTHINITLRDSYTCKTLAIVRKLTTK